MAQQSEHDEPLDRLAWIDEQASRFETAWRAGARPSIEGCAEKAPPDLKTALLKELILLDHELHQAAGRPSKAIDYRARFPELGEWLSSHLDRPRLERRDAETRAIPPVESPVESEQANLPRLTHYAISSILGKGGMGVVYLGRKRDRVEDHCLAVKMLHRSSSAEVRNRFLDEMATMARLQHPHIVPIIDSGYDHDHILYFVMPYFPAGDLAAALASSGPLPAATAAEYALAVAWALDYLHERGIVHRDLKLRNILLDEYRDSRFPLGRPWLADFGLVKLLETWTTSHEGGRITGTVMNMSPEQASGRNDEVGPRSDLWAVGVLLFELLTRRAPFAGESIDQVRYQIMRHEPMSVRILQPKTPRDLERIVAKCLEKNPDDRYASAAALIADLTAFLRNEPLPHATPKRPWERVERWARRKPALALRGAVIAALLTNIWVNRALGGLGWRSAPKPDATRWPAYVSLFMEFWFDQLLLLAWAGASWLFQRWAERGGPPLLVRVSWLATDALILTALLWNVEALNSPLIVAYAVLIVASGLWQDLRLVAITTAFSLIGYFSLLALNRSSATAPYEMLHVVTTLIALCVLVRYYLRRSRLLERIYRQDPTL